MEQPGSYITRKTIFKPDFSLGNRAEDRLNVRLGDVVYKNEDNVEVVFGRNNLSFSYDSLPKNKKIKFKEHELTEIKKEIEKYVEIIGGSIDDFSDYFNPDNWRELKEFKFISNDNKKKIDLSKILSPIKKSRVFFYSGQEKENMPPNGFFYSQADKNNSSSVLIMNKINSILSMVIMLHEIGHLYGRENKAKKHNKLDVFFANRMNRQEILAEELYSERTATAFAIKQLKPFFDGGINKKDVINYLKQKALGSYSDKIDRENGILEEEKYIYDETGTELTDYVKGLLKKYFKQTLMYKEEIVFSFDMWKKDYQHNPEEEEENESLLIDFLEFIGRTSEAIEVCKIMRDIDLLKKKN